jgi:hypothetical protein
MSRFKGEIADLPGTARMASEAMLDWLKQIDGYRGLLGSSTRSRAARASSRSGRPRTLS